MSRYYNPALKQLAEQQLRYAPVEVRIEQIERADEFLADVVLDQTYTYEDVCQRVTDYRSDRFPDLVISGRDISHDLRCFVEDLSDTVDLSADSFDEPVLTVTDVSQRFNVSTKTVDRWRNRGLASRRFRIGNRKRVGFLQSSVDRFVERHAQDVVRGSRFSQLSDDERFRIIRRARRLARAGANPAEISRRLSQRFQRSQETIRYTLRNHDEQHPEFPVFPHSSSPLTDPQKRSILHSFRRGIAVEQLCEWFRRTRASIYRIIAEQRAAQILENKIDFMHSEEFCQPEANDVILKQDPPDNPKAGTSKPPPGLPPYLTSLYSTSLLNRAQEAYYFRKMNYLKYKAAALRDELDAKKPSTRLCDRIEGYLQDAQEVKNFLIRSNLRLVVSIAKKHINPQSSFFEMVSDGNMSLIRSIEKFDYTRGNKFSTYATWAIMKNFARSVPAEHTQLDRFRTGNDEMFQGSTDQKSNPYKLELDNQVQRRVLMRILDELDRREKQIIICRFGLEPAVEPQTLEQLGRQLGVTKERVRQIQTRALRKLKKIAGEQSLDIPGI